MRRSATRLTLALTIAALALSAGCARQGAPTADWPAGVKEAEVYEQVLRRYLTTAADNSFPEHTFETVYVLDHAQPDAAEPSGDQRSGVAIPSNTQAHIISALGDIATVTFVADKESVLDGRDGCAEVKDGGILITLGTVDGDDIDVNVGINGFVACLGATWLTYAVQNQDGAGWAVTGTTGSVAIA